MALKNYTSEGRGTFEKIQNILTNHGANKIMYDYNADGTLKAITFGLDINGQPAGFRLPALVENVAEILYGGQDRWGRTKKITNAQREQAYRTAWANIRDWIDAQMALVDTRRSSWNKFSFRTLFRKMAIHFLKISFWTQADY
jgi:hypothetical protein